MTSPCCDSPGLPLLPLPSTVALSPELPPLQRPLDVDALLTSSRPRPSRLPGAILLIGIAVCVAMFSGPASGSPSPLGVINAGLLLVTGALLWLLVSAARRHQREQAALAHLHEHVQLRQWVQAAADVAGLLAKPLLLPTSRFQALIYLAAVLARYQRYGDSLRVIELVIDEGRLDPASDAGMQAGRVLALLREDRLVDADTALTQLKRRSPQRTATLAMMELYRSIRTGHNDDALEMFQRDRPLLRAQAGHQQADGWALAARAALQLGRSGDARRMARNAMLLVDAREIIARFPETAAAFQNAAQPEPGGAP